MRSFLFLTVFIFSMQSRAVQIHCDGEKASKDPARAGSILLEISPRDCVKSASGESCFRHVELARDHCKNDETLIKVSCEGDRTPASQEVPCPEGTRCDKNICR